MTKKVEIDIIGKNAGLKRALGDSKKDVDSFGKSVSHAAKVAIAAFAGFEVIHKVTGLLVDATKVASLHQQAQARLGVALKDSKVHWKGAEGAVESYLQKQAKLSGFVRNDLSDAFAANIRATDSVTKSQRLLNIEMDIARTRGISVAAASSLVNRVYNGSYLGLKKLGIGFDKTTVSVDKLKKAHDEAAAAGKKFTKQELIDYKQKLLAAKAADHLSDRERALSILKKKFGGQAAAYAKTEQGAIDRLKVAYEELQLKVGAKVLPKIKKLVDFLAKIAGAKSLSVAIKIAWKGIEGMVKELKTQLFGGTEDGRVHIPVHMALQQGRTVDTHTQVNGIASDMKDAFDKVDWGPVGHKIATGITAALKFSDKAFNGILNAALKWSNSHAGQIAEVGVVIGLNMFNKLLDPSFWAAHWKLIGALILNVITTIFPEGKFAALGEKFGLKFALGFLRLGEKLGPRLGAVLARTIDIIDRFGASLPGRALRMADNFLNAISRQFGKLGKLVKFALTVGILTEIENFITSIPGAAKRLGFAIKDNIVGGLVGMGGDLIKLARGALSELANELESFHASVKTKSFHGIPYPSGFSIGFNAGGGMIAGRYSDGDIHPAMLSGGEAVLNPKQIDMVGRQNVMNVLRATGAPTHGGHYAAGRAPIGSHGQESDSPRTLKQARDNAQHFYNAMLKALNKAIDKQKTDRNWLAHHSDKEFLGGGKHKVKNKLYSPEWKHRHLEYGDAKTGDAAVVSFDRSELAKAKTALDNAKTKYSNFLKKKKDFNDSIPGTAAFGVSVNALNAKLAQDSYDNADADSTGPLSAVEQGDYDQLIGAYTNRITYLKKLLTQHPSAARRDAINQELQSDYSDLGSFRDAKRQDNTPADNSGGGSGSSSGSGSTGPTADEQAQNDQNATLAGYYRRGQALQGAADSVLGGSGHTININMSAMHPADSSVLQQIGSTVTSALDRQPSIGTNKQTVLV